MTHTPHTISAKYSLTHIVTTTDLFLEKPKLFGYPYRITYYTSVETEGAGGAAAPPDFD